MKTGKSHTSPSLLHKKKACSLFHHHSSSSLLTVPLGFHIHLSLPHLFSSFPNSPVFPPLTFLTCLRAEWVAHKGTHAMSPSLYSALI